MPVGCPNCGTTNADGAGFCVSCGASLASAAAPPPPPAPGGFAPPPPPPPGGYAPPPPYPGAPSYGAPTPGYAPGGGAITNHMGMAIASLVVGLFCGCVGVIPGLVAVIMASQVNGKLGQGDVMGAQASAKNARTWAMVAFVVAAVLTIGWILLVAFTGSFNFSTSS